MMNRDGIRKIFLSNIMLRFFYSWMVIYTPIYLHEHIGFSWGEIGLIFSIMLVPFVVLGSPLGKIADKYIGEKELLSLGFVIVAVSTAYLSFVDSSNFLVWALVLLVTRIGASMVDIMSETYFFKKIDGSDSNLLGFFRMTGPIAFIIGPLLATLVLPFVGIKYLFLVLGILMLWGLRYSLTLKDTL
jgi:MFS family permease